jgi:hypothetical protein
VTADLVWPVCTVAGCSHGLTHQSTGALWAVAAAFPEWVNKRTGVAVCRCHAAIVANDAGVDPFGCDPVRANLGPVAAAEEDE